MAFLIPIMKEDNSKIEESQDKNSKDYETIRKLVKDKDLPKKKIKKILMYSISMVEVIANSLEDTLIDGRSFKIAKTASYTTNRRSCTFSSTMNPFTVREHGQS